MDIVYIKNLQIECIIGIFDWEREVKQRVSIDLEMSTDIRPAAETDDIADPGSGSIWSNHRRGTATRRNLSMTYDRTDLTVAASF